MNVKKNLENRIRGWLPKDLRVYSVKRIVNSKGLAVYFILLLIIGVLIPIFITPLFLPPSLIPAINESILMLLFTGTMLALVYYIRTRGTPKQVRLFFFICIGGGLGFPIFAVATLIVNTVVGHTVQGFDLSLDYVFSFIVAFIISIPVSKKMQKRFFLNLEGVSIENGGYESCAPTA